MIRFRVVAVLALAFPAGIAACGSDAADGVQSGDGATLFAVNCATCHGPDSRGTVTGPSLLSSLYEPATLSDDLFRASIESGVEQKNWEFGPMPMQPALSSAEIDAIVLYVRETQQREGFEPYPPSP